MSKEDELLKIESLISQLATTVNSTMATEKEIHDQIESIRREMDEKIANSVARLDAIRRDNYLKRSELRSLNLKREMLAHEAEEEKAHKSLLDKYDIMKSRLEEIRFNYIWSSKIMKHQVSGAEFLALRKRTVLADVMGTGKTLTVISSLDYIREVTKDASHENPFVIDALDRFPVVAPAGKKVLYLSSAELSWGVWQEFKQWAPHRNVIFLTGFSKAIRRVVIDSLKELDEYTVIMNYEGWRKDFNLLPILGSLKFDTIICDESHKLKEGNNNIGWKGANAIMEQTPSPYRIMMTGTPVLNKPQELYNQLVLLDPYLFFSERAFLQEYCEQVKIGGQLRWQFQPGGIELLYRKIGPIILRRTKKDAGIELPPQTIIHHNLDIDAELYPNQARVRKEMRDYASIMLDPSNTDKGYVSAAAQIAVLTRLRQIESWPHLMRFKNPQTELEIELGISPTYTELDCEESQKLDYILNGVFDMGIATEAIQAEEKVVIFSQFTKTLEELDRRFKKHGYRSALFTGNTSRIDREDIKRQFDASKTNPEDMTYDVVLANYKVGGEGVNFTNASQTIIDDEEWNPGKRDQAYDRTNRIGQVLPTTIHVVRMNKTVDGWLASLIDFKEGMVNGFESTFNSNQAYEALQKGDI